MRPLLILLFTSMALAQQGEDARPLLQQVADAARNVKSWRVEADIAVELKGDGIALNVETHRREAVGDPGHARVEMTAAGVPILSICDGTSTWAIVPSLNKYQKLSGIQSGCPTSLEGWAGLLDNLQSAVIAGQDTVVFEGVPIRCDLVRAEYAKLPIGFELPEGANLPGAGTRTMCIDRSRLLILRDYSEATAISLPSGPKNLQLKSTIVYSAFDLHPVFSPDLFRYEPPPGSTLIATPAPAASAPARSTPAPRVNLGPLPPLVSLVGNGVTMPTLISRVEPTYTQEAQAAKIDGTVILRIEVDTEGIPQNIRVLRSLEPGLDENAIYAVSQWRFRPGMKDGKPVIVAAQVEVNFRLLQKPPPGTMLP